MKYYYPEHEAAYRHIEREGKRAWDDLHGADDAFEHFPNRPFLEQVLPKLALPRPEQTDVPDAADEGAMYVGGRAYWSHRRHLRPDVLAREFGAAGIRVLRQGGALGGDLACVRDDHPT